MGAKERRKSVKSKSEIKHSTSFIVIFVFFCVFFGISLFLGVFISVQPRNRPEEDRQMNASEYLKDGAEVEFNTTYLQMKDGRWESGSQREAVEINDEDSITGNSIKAYTDVILSVITSIDIALTSIGATIFIFSKTSLDRINDENEYVSDIVRIHKMENIWQLTIIGISSVMLIILPIFWHFVLTFLLIHTL